MGSEHPQRSASTLLLPAAHRYPEIVANRIRSRAAKDAHRLKRLLVREQQLWETGLERVAGVDETCCLDDFGWRESLDSGVARR